MCRHCHGSQRWKRYCLHQWHGGVCSAVTHFMYKLGGGWFKSHHRLCCLGFSLGSPQTFQTPVPLEGNWPNLLLFTSFLLSSLYLLRFVRCSWSQLPSTANTEFQEIVKVLISSTLPGSFTTFIATFIGLWPNISLRSQCCLGIVESSGTVLTNFSVQMRLRWHRTLEKPWSP